jgi:hypothetical protein
MRGNSSCAEERDLEPCAAFFDIGLPHDLIALGKPSGVEQVVGVIDNACRWISPGAGGPGAGQVCWSVHWPVGACRRASLFVSAWQGRFVANTPPVIP